MKATLCVYKKCKNVHTSSISTKYTKLKPETFIWMLNIDMNETHKAMFKCAAENLKKKNNIFLTFSCNK